MKTLLLAAVIFISSLSCFAHPGGTDNNGCRHDNKTGGYHSH